MNVIILIIFIPPILSCNCLTSDKNCIKDILTCKYPEQNDFNSLLYFVIIILFWSFILILVMKLFENILLSKSKKNITLYDRLINYFFILKKIKLNKVRNLKKKKKTRIDYEFSNNIIHINFKKSNSILQKLNKEIL